MFRNLCIMYSCCDLANPEGKPEENGGALALCKRTCPSGAVADSTSWSEELMQNACFVGSIARCVNGDIALTEQW